MTKRPYPRWERRHEAVLLWLLEHPTATLREGAVATGYSPSHLSRITCSPEFRQQMLILRAELERQVLSRVTDRLTAAKTR
jgi:hypothetical protein